MGNSTYTLPDRAVLEGRVSQGVSFLDSHHPGWAMKVDIDALEGDCPRHCVSGQLFGESLSEQAAAMGLAIDLADSREAAESIVDTMVGLGLWVRAVDFGPAPPTLVQLLREMGVIPEGEEPPLFPYKRDPSLLAMEASTLQVLWERKIRERVI